MFWFKKIRKINARAIQETDYEGNALWRRAFRQYPKGYFSRLSKVQDMVNRMNDIELAKRFNHAVTNYVDPGTIFFYDWTKF